MRKVKDIEFEFPLTNFTITVVAECQRDGIFHKQVIFTKDNQKSRMMVMTVEDQWKDFQNFLTGAGRYFWKGTPEDLRNLWQYIDATQPIKMVFEPEYIGCQEDGLFLFENIAIKDGKTIFPDDTGTFWLGKEGIKPRSISVSKTDSSDGLPYISYETPISIEEIRDKLSDSMGLIHASTALSWCASVLYMDEVFDKYNCFPFLFITGKRRSGKSTIGEWLTNLFGFTNSGKMWADTTPVGMSRLLAYQSSLPLWIDEFRNDTRNLQKINMLRNVYQRQSSGKGVKSDFGVRFAPIRGTCIITGEETPNDNALMSRCIPIEMVESTRTDKSSKIFDWFTQRRIEMSNFTYQVLKNKPLNTKEYIQKLAEYKTDLASIVSDDRASINSAIVAAGYYILFGEDKNFARGITLKTKEDKQNVEEEGIVQRFFEDASAMEHAGILRNKYWQFKDEMLYIYFQGLYNEWAIYYKRVNNIEPFKLQSLRNYLKQEPGFISASVNHRFDAQDSSVKSCMKFQVSELKDYMANLPKT
jgi:DNA primase